MKLFMHLGLISLLAATSLNYAMLPLLTRRLLTPAARLGMQKLMQPTVAKQLLTDASKFLQVHQGIKQEYEKQGAKCSALHRKWEHLRVQQSYIRATLANMDANRLSWWQQIKLGQALAESENAQIVQVAELIENSAANDAQKISKLQQIQQKNSRLWRAMVSLQREINAASCAASPSYDLHTTSRAAYQRYYQIACLPSQKKEQPTKAQDKKAQDKDEVVGMILLYYWYNQWS